MHRYKNFVLWIVIAGGLLWGYNGITDMELQTIVLGDSLGNVVEIIVGIAAVIMIYLQLTTPKKARK